MVLDTRLPICSAFSGIVNDSSGEDYFFAKLYPNNLTCLFRGNHEQGDVSAAQIILLVVSHSVEAIDKATAPGSALFP
jgi:hypothetical protein